MTEAVHKAGGKIAMQIVHGGVLSSPELTGEEVLGPSAMQSENGPVGREMTKEEIQETVEAFVKAASRAEKAGFDGLQIHIAHTYLLNQFLSPFFNKRTDEYGGSLENRARMLMQVVSRVKDTVAGYPILVKLNSEDLLEGGLTKEEMLEVCAMLQHAGIDAIELSGGTTLGLFINKLEITPFPIGNGDVYWRKAAEQYKKKIDVPLILVGGIRSFETAEQLVEGGVADYVSMSRPLIREPDLINRWKTGDTRKADCVSDNACLQPGIEGKGVHCAHLVQ
jgi:2,4-dienoyl-CoA reductase-like NADH-dependent reductase (Old Yellow Enzyme family)